MRSLFLALLLIGFSSAFSANEAPAASHRILVKIGSNNLTQKDFDEMGEVMFRLFYPERKLSEIAPQELEQLNPLALKEAVIIYLVEDEIDLLEKGKDDKSKIKVSSQEITRHQRNAGTNKLFNNRMATRYSRTQLALNQLLRTYIAEPTPAPKIVEQFYKKNLNTVFTTERFVKVRHIFLHSAPDDEESAKRKATQIFEELKRHPLDKISERFAKAARDFSQDNFRSNGGLLILGDKEGWFPQEHNFKMPDGTTFFPQPMLDGVIALKKTGDLELRKSERGWHLLLLEDIKGGQNVEYKKVKRTIEDYLMQLAIDTARESWLTNKIKRTHITWNDGSAFPVDKVLGGVPEEQRLNMLHQHIIRMLESQKK